MITCNLVGLITQGITIVTIIILGWIKLERRLTKIEVDVKWLKKFIETNGRALIRYAPGGENKDGGTR